MEDGNAVIHRWSPEAVVGGSVADDVLAGNVLVVVVERGIECLCRGDLVDVSRRHGRAARASALEATSSWERRYSRTVVLCVAVLFFRVSDRVVDVLRIRLLV